MTCADAQYCTGSTCTCDPGLTDCGGGFGCSNLTNDVQNCGACGRSCLGLGLANPRCVRGACQDTTCRAIGQAFCNGNCVDPASIDTDALNCGGCGNVCVAGEVCAAGNCRGYTQPPSCTSCPCAACGAGAACCTFGGEAICVAGGTCP
jgi:hypothetical protein